MKKPRHDLTGPAVRQRFTAALDGLVGQVRNDRSILAAILCGSLSHDTVWAKSDIDLVLVTVDDRNVKQGDLTLNADGVNVHAILFPRGEFRKLAEGAIRNSFIHSFLSKGSLLYTHDPTIGHLCEALHDRGPRDKQVQLLRAATQARPPIDKAHKWFVTRGDLDYTALWVLYAATPIAQMEVIAADLLVDREVIPQAIALNPPLFKTIYTDLLNQAKTRPRVEAALQAVDRYIGDRASEVFAPILEYLRDVGEPRSCRELEDHFTRNLDVAGVTTACEYLADQGLLGKAAAPAHLTKKSSIEVEELAFFYIDAPSR